MSPTIGPARGILRHSSGPGVFHHARIAPAAALAGIIQHFWIVRWDLRGCAPQSRETLPHPNVHMVLEPGKSRLHGIHSGRFTVVLEEQGSVFGVKFRPGGFRPFLQRSVSTLRERSLLPREVFGSAAEAWENDVLVQPGDAQKVASAEAFFLARLPPPDPDVARAGDIVDAIASDRGLTRVEQLQQRWEIGTRSLQRLFNEYVGVGPKWVLNRYRLHEAIERLAQGDAVDWCQLALELGYFDQAHFIRDFRTLVGRPPGDYVRRHVSDA